MSEFIRYKSLRSIAGFEPIINTKKLVPSLTSKNSSQISRLVCADNPSLIKRPSLEFRERQIDSCKETA